MYFEWIDKTNGGNKPTVYEALEERKRRRRNPVALLVTGLFFVPKFRLIKATKRLANEAIGRLC